MVFSPYFKGLMSTFGGPLDTGVKPSENLAFTDDPSQVFSTGGLFSRLQRYFLPFQPPGTTGLARRLDPATFYLACRWRPKETPWSFLKANRFSVYNPANKRIALAQPIDWGPSPDRPETRDRVADLSPGLASALQLKTDDPVEIYFPNDPNTPSGEVQQQDGNGADQPPSNAGSPSGPSSTLSDEQVVSFFSNLDPGRQANGSVVVSDSWQSSHLAPFLIPALADVDGTHGGKIICHKLIGAKLQGAFQAISDAGLEGRILTWDGCFNPRPRTGNASAISVHSWGIAFDINAQFNAFGDEPAAFDEDGSVRELVKIFASFGFYWGGNFGHSGGKKDGMHFEFAQDPNAP